MIEQIKRLYNTPMVTNTGTLSGNLTNIDRIFGLSLLWREAYYNFAFFERQPDLDWNKAYRDFLPEAIAAEGTYAYYRVLARFMALLKDGHSGVILPPDVLAQQVDFPPVALQEVEGAAVVTGVSSALVDRIPPGSLVTALDGTPVDAALQENVLPYVFANCDETRRAMAVRGVKMFGYGLLAGPTASTVRLTIMPPDGAARTVDVRRDLSSAPVEWVGWQAIEPPASLLEFRWLEEGIACVALNSFMDEQIVRQFEAHKPDLLRARAVILDLRRNTGGSTGNGAAILDHFSERALTGSRSRTRQSTAARRAWGQFGGEHAPHGSGDEWVVFEPEQREVIEGPKILAPTAVLTGRGTISAAEDFLVLADGIPHVTTVGSPTFGSTGQPLAFDLPGGGLGFVCTKHDSYPDEREFVGPGVQPEIKVTYTKEDFRQGNDADLAAALAFLHGELAKTNS